MALEDQRASISAEDARLPETHQPAIGSRNWKEVGPLEKATVVVKAPHSKKSQSLHSAGAGVTTPSARETALHRR